MPLSPDQIRLFHRLMKVAIVDQGRALSATWSSDRLRTLLMDECLQRGLQLVDRPIEGAPSGSRMERALGVPGAAPPDLSVLDARGRKLLNLDLVCGSDEGGNHDGGRFKPDHVYNSIVRVNNGFVDALIVSTDAAVYDGLHRPVNEMDGRDRMRLNVFTAVLPPVSQVSMKEPRRITIDDTTLAVYGARSSAFGLGRVMVGVCNP